MNKLQASIENKGITKIERSLTKNVKRKTQNVKHRM